MRLVVHSSAPAFALEAAPAMTVAAALARITAHARWLAFLRALDAQLPGLGFPQHHVEMVATVLRQALAFAEKETLTENSVAVCASDVTRALVLALDDAPAAELVARLTPALTYTQLVCCKRTLEPDRTFASYFGPNDKTTLSVFVS